MILIDADAGGRVLFAETFEGSLPLFPEWDEQPPAFRDLMRERAKKVALAALHEHPPVEEDHDAVDTVDLGEPEWGD
jgi:hypothetical protein